MKQILIAGLITLTLSVDNALAQSRDDWPSPFLMNILASSI